MKPYPPNLRVRTLELAALESSIRLNGHCLSPEQLANADQNDQVKKVHAFHAGVPFYSLQKLPGIWPHWTIQTYARNLTVNYARHRRPADHSIINGKEIYVGGLPYAITDTLLLKIFIKFGDVEKICIVKDRVTGRSKGFARVWMASISECSTAIAELNGKEILENGEYASAYNLADNSTDERLNNENIAVVQIIETSSMAFVELICKEPRRLQEIEWRDLERMLAMVFDGIGYAVRLTRGAKDGGKDIIITFIVSDKIHSYYVEVKHWVSGKKIGERQIKEFLSVVVRDQQEGGIFISTSGFNASATQGITEIERKKLRFGDKDTVVSLCRTYLNVRRGLMYPLNPIDTLISLTNKQVNP